MHRINIAVRGNKTTGFEPLYNGGSRPMDIPYDTENAGGCQYYFVVCIEPEQTVYIIKTQRVKGYGALRTGMLAIAIGIEKGYTLANERNPYDALTRLFQTFVDRYMTKDSGGCLAFEPSDIPPTALDEFLDEFPLIPYDGPYLPMKGSEDAYICIPKERLSEFFRDVQYPELQSYKKVVINPEQPLSLIPGMEIPRKKRYLLQVFYKDGTRVEQFLVNGGPVAQPYRLEGDRDYYAVADNPANTGSQRYYELDEKKFVVKQLRNATRQDVTLDEKNETIRVTLTKPKAKEEKWTIQFDDDKAEQAFNKYPFCKFRIAKQCLDVKGGTITLRGEQIGWLEKESIEPESIQGGRFRATRIRVDRNNHRLIVETEQLPSHQQNIHTNEIESGINQHTQPTSQDDQDEIVIILPYGLVNKTLNVRVETKDGKTYRATFERPGQEHIPSQGKKDSKQNKTKFLKKYKKWLVSLLVAMIIGMIIGGVLGCGIRTTIDKHENSREDEFANNEEPSAPSEEENETAQMKKMKKTLEDAKRKLAEEDLYFKTVDELYTNVCESPDSACYHEIDSDAFHSIIAYKKVVYELTNKDRDRTYLLHITDKSDPDYVHINGIHIEAIKNIFDGKKTKKNFKDSIDTYKSFGDLKKIGSNTKVGGKDATKKEGGVSGEERK